MRRLFICGLLLLGVTGCYSKHLILQAEAVSMTEKHADDVKSLQSGKQVNETWCIGEEPVFTDGTEDYGLADQVIYKAQGEGKKADFITEARIWRDSKGCAILEGRLAKK